MAVRERQVFRGAQVAANGLDAREDAGYVAIEYGQRHIVSDAQDCCGGVDADARKFERDVECAREFSVVLRDNQFCGAMQIAGATVVAET